MENNDSLDAEERRLPNKRRTRAKAPRIKNLDVAVLRKEAQVPTHVTPLIYQYSQGYFSEDVVIIGPEMAPRDPGSPPEDVRKCIWKLMQRHESPKRKIRLGRAIESGPFLTYIKVDDVVYRVSALI